MHSTPPVCILRDMRRLDHSRTVPGSGFRAPAFGRPTGSAAGRCGRDGACRSRIHRVPALGLALFVLASMIPVHGCTRPVRLPPEEMHAGAVLDRSRVFMRGGREFRFDRVTLTPDSLVGEYRVLQETDTGREAIRFEEVYRSYPVALAEVDSVLVDVRSIRRGILYGAGIGAVAGLIYFLRSGDDDGADDGGEKPGQPQPLR